MDTLPYRVEMMALRRFYKGLTSTRSLYPNHYQRAYCSILVDFAHPCSLLSVAKSRLRDSLLPVPCYER